MTRKERSYLLPRLSPADRKLLAELPRRASLADEIAYLRLRIGELAQDADRDPNMLVRMLELLTRMVAVQAKLGADEGESLADLVETVRRRLAEAANESALS